MLTFSRLGRKGNLGNQLFQIASVAGIAQRNGHSYAFPEWAYSNFFTEPLPVAEPSLSFEKINETHFHYEEMQFSEGNYDLEGWFQTESYFGENARSLFNFKASFLEGVRRKFQEVLSNDPIVISVRRGDFVGHPDYFQLPILYYINALYRYFPDWQQRNIILLSDDISYCRYHFDFLPNVFFADNASAIEQLAFSGLCKDFIISNSTFSWWCAWFGEKPGSQIIRPEYNFSDEKRKDYNEKDYFPKRWTKFTDHGKIILEDIAIRLSKENQFLEKYLRHHFRYGQGGEAEIVIRDYIVPPLSIKIAADLLKKNSNSEWLLKYNPVKISSLLDIGLLQEQQDFGMFVNSKKQSKLDEVAFTCHTKNRITADSDLKFYIQTGKLDIFAFSHFYNRYKKKGLFKLKTVVKKLIGYKKK